MLLPTSHHTSPLQHSDSVKTSNRSCQVRTYTVGSGEHCPVLIYSSIAWVIDLCLVVARGTGSSCSSPSVPRKCCRCFHAWSLKFADRSCHYSFVGSSASHSSSFPQMYHGDLAQILDRDEDNSCRKVQVNPALKDESSASRHCSDRRDGESANVREGLIFG